MEPISYLLLTRIRVWEDKESVIGMKDEVASVPSVSQRYPDSMRLALWVRTPRGWCRTNSKSKEISSRPLPEGKEKRVPKGKIAKKDEQSQEHRCRWLSTYSNGDG